MGQPKLSFNFTAVDGKYEMTSLDVKTNNIKNKHMTRCNYDVHSYIWFRLLVITDYSR